jgi:excisionase family DNA binding protein
MTEAKLAPATINLIDQITRPLCSAGALHTSERNALLSILRGAVKDSPEQKNLLTIGEAATALSVSKKTIGRMIEAGELEAVYLRKGSPRTRRVKASSLDLIGGLSQ